MSYENDTRSLPKTVSFSDIRFALKAQRRFVAIMFAALMLLPITYLHVAAYTYTVSLDVVSARQGASSPGGSLGQLAGLANIPMLQGNMDRDFELYLEGLRSREVARLLIDKNPGILETIFAGEWDATKQKWRSPGPVQVALKQAMNAFIGTPYRPWAPPSAERLQEYLLARIKVNRTRDNPVVSIEINVRDPAFGSRLLWALHRSVDSYLKERAVRRNTLYINYITQKLKEVTLEEHRQALIQTLSSTERARMMASSDLDYAAESFGMPMASVRPTKPNAPLIIVVFAAIALSFSMFVAILRDHKGRPDLDLSHLFRSAFRRAKGEAQSFGEGN